MALISPKQRFGRLTTIWRDLTKLDKKHMYWDCKCDCGNIISVQSSSLNTGATKSCGCLQKESIARIRTTHGQTGTTEYSSWKNMKNRCTNSRNKRYIDYGGRGIKVCSEWLDSFETFLKDMGPKPTYEHTLERNNNDGNYEPSNCRWATKLEQASNKRNIKLVENPSGKLETISKIAKDNGFKMGTLLARLNKGMTIEEALNKPVEKLYLYNGFILTLNDWATKTGISRKILYDRIEYQNWSIERALTTPIKP